MTDVTPGQDHSPNLTLRFLGHACVALDYRGSTLLIDPYEPNGFQGAMRYRKITEHVDHVVCTHDHADHSGHRHLPGTPTLIDVGRCGSFNVARHSVWHDEYDGRRKGGAVDILDIGVGPFRIVHASDVGQSPTADLVRSLRKPDILFIPVGGNFTIGAAQAWEWTRRLSPRVVVPIHFSTPQCDLSLLRSSVFQSYFPGSPRKSRGNFRLPLQSGFPSTKPIYLSPTQAEE
jgi:L-ascorbate metabolism protein UlaG (beta-lactamase superfamily)